MDLLAHADTLENRADIVERRTTVPDGYKPKEAPSQTNHSLDGHSLSRSNKGQLSIAAAHYKKVTADVLAIPKGALPAFDQIQVDRRFLTELDYLLKIRALPSYTAWAQAVDVSANYVAAIERGRYHCNLELLYRTARCFPDFDFNYVLFGSASSNRPEPTDLPKRDRGRRKESDFWERLKDIITSNNLAENELWPGDCIDLANDKKVYELYVDEYGPIKDHNKYMHDIEGIINVIINEIKAESNK